MKLRLLDIVLTLISRILIVGFVIVFSPFFFATAFIPKEKLYESKLFFFLGDIMYRVMYRLLFLPTTVKGSSNVPDGQVIFVANHQSSLDIPLLGMLAKQRPHAWLAMAELSKSIVLRWIVRATISVDMSSPIKGMRSLIAAIKVIKDDKMSVMIFPEGRRYVDGKVHDFFAGFAILAKQTGLPVVPVRIFGVHKAYPPRQFWVRHVPVTVVVGKPFVYQDDESDESFKNRVEAWFMEQSEH